MTTLPPGGEQFPLRHAGYAAVVTQVGATLRELELDGRPLVAGFAQDRVRPVYRGALLAPWPNRVRDGRYRFGGAELQLPLNEVDRHNALHGLVLWNDWQAAGHSDDAVTLTCRVAPSEPYPFALDLRMRYRLGADGLSCALTALNSGTADAPYGAGAHPYLVAPDGPLDGWSLQLEADRYLTVDDRLLPTGTAPVDGTAYDFRGGRQVGAQRVDHAFTALAGQGAGGSAAVTGPDGRGTRLSWGPGTRWVQVHTADRPEPELDRSSLVVEPMTCPPDAYNSGEDLVVLAPGEEHTLTWRLSAA